MKTEWTMTDDELEESLLREAEEAEEQELHKFERECEQIQEEIEKQYGYA